MGISKPFAFMWTAFFIKITMSENGLRMLGLLITLQVR